MSTILATELFQARHDAAVATSKLLLENSGYELSNAPINAKTLFDNKIKEVAKANYEVQQRRFLASFSTITNVQQQKSSYSASGTFKRPRQLSNSARPKQTKLYRTKTQTQSFTIGTKKRLLRGIVTRDSSPPLNRTHLPQSSESQTLSTFLPRPDIPVGGRLAHFVEQWGEITDKNGSFLSFEMISGYHSG